MSSDGAEQPAGDEQPDGGAEQGPAALGERGRRWRARPASARRARHRDRREQLADDVGARSRRGARRRRSAAAGARAPGSRGASRRRGARSRGPRPRPTRARRAAVPSAPRGLAPSSSAGWRRVASARRTMYSRSAGATCTRATSRLSSTSSSAVITGRELGRGRRGRGRPRGSRARRRGRGTPSRCASGSGRAGPRAGDRCPRARSGSGWR